MAKHANMSVKWPLIHVRALYFVQCLAACCVSNFIVVYFKAKGLDVHEIGLIIGGIYPFVQLLGGPFFCALADRVRRPKTVVLTSLLLGTTGTCCLLFVDGFQDTAIVTGCATFLGSAVNPMLDSTTMRTLTDNGADLEHYGQYRVFGAIGWGISALAIGPMIDSLGIDWLFYDYAIFSCFFFLLLALFDLKTDASVRDDDDAHKPHIIAEPNEAIVSVQAAEDNDGETLPLLDGRKELTTTEYFRTLCGRPGALAFFVLVVTMGVAKGTIDAFLFIYLQDMGASGLLLGLTLAVTTVSEIPFFFYSGPILRRVGAVSTCLMALLAYAARLGYYSLIPSPWYVLPAELLHGLTFGLSWAAMAAHSAVLAPKGYTSTTQGLASALFFGLGFGSGALAGGFIAAEVGFRTLFLGVGVMTFAAACLGFLVQWCWR
eukprot:TRINITY_DN6686_c0_g1_i1.p1 TRINITY_DN6686_c0_g1~~TRINITY_DN6686_c0_g1_i1.p1  ORF type:complete len:432 (+),score=61.62 TRINITY_DN6686_c0_g1_i1:72-1367(+)